MRQVEWTDADGYKHLVWLRDRDPDEEAAQGIPCDPPPLDSLGLEDTRALHNVLVERRLLIWQNSVDFKRGLAEAAGTVGLDASLLQKLYTSGPPPKVGMAFDLETALDTLPYTDRQRECIKQAFSQARIRDLAGVQNAPTRVGHICGLDIYLIVARLLGKEV